MKKINVEAFEDRSRPQGGHAVILLHGVMSVSDRPRFRLKPLESGRFADGGGAEGSGWSNSEHSPITSRLTEQGIELVVGPEIVESPQMLAGTVTVIELPEASVRGEFLWPMVKPLARPKRRHLAVVKPQRPAAEEPAAPEPETTVAVPVEAWPGASEQRPGQVAPTTAAVASVADGGFVFVAEADETVAAAGDAPETGTPSTGAGAALAAAPTPMHAAAALPDATSSAPVLPHLEPEAVPATAPTTRRRPSGLFYAAAGLAGLALLYPVLSDRLHRRPEVKPTAQIAARHETQPTAADSRQPLPSLFRSLSVGVVSPKGTHTGDKDTARIFEEAEKHLHGAPDQRDSAEAVFWLKRYLAGAIGDEHTVWALTQLGTQFAEPTSGIPDFAVARVLWEIAGAYGDPVAMCFLGTLHESGLGVPADRRVALLWFQRAKQSGGCQAADEAINRLSR